MAGEERVLYNLQAHARNEPIINKYQLFIVRPGAAAGFCGNLKYKVIQTKKVSKRSMETPNKIVHENHCMISDTKKITSKLSVVLTKSVEVSSQVKENKPKTTVQFLKREINRIQKLGIVHETREMASDLHE